MTTHIHLILNILLVLLTVQCDSISNPPENSTLSQPVLREPDSASILQNLTVRLSWTEVQEADNYLVQITDMAVFDTVLTSSVIRETQYEYGDLAYNQTYFWRVQAIGKQQNIKSPWSETWSFSTPETPDNEPLSTNLQAPGDGWQNQPTTLPLNWTIVPNATYRIHLSSDQSFSSFHSDTTIDSTTYVANELSFDETYYWKVLPKIDGQQTVWSDVYSFTTKKSENEDDTSNPEVSISSSHQNIYQGETLTITASASDKSGISRIELYINEELINTCSDTTSCSYSSNSLSIGEHSFHAVAFDASSSENKAFSEIKKIDVLEPEPANTEARIMPLGDSITAAFGYRVHLWNMLTENGYKIDYVGSQSEPHPNLPDTDHEGHSGWTIGDIKSKVNSWLSNHQPDIVLLMIGTNDIAWWSSLTANEIADKHASLVDQIHANTSSDTWILVASVPPQSSKIISPLNIDRQQLTIEFNAAVEERMQQRINNGRKIEFVDIHSQLTVDHLTDGIHPNEEGYQIIAESWYQALLPVFP